MARSCNGLTIVELMCVMVVFAMMTGMIFAVTDSGSKVWARTEGQIATFGHVQRAMDRVSEDLRRASIAGKPLPEDPALHKPALQTCCVEPGQLDFTMLKDDNSKVRVTYAFDGGTGRLTRTQEGVSAVVASNLTRFTPTSQSGGRVRLQVTAQVTMPNGVASIQNLDSQVLVQNP